MRTPFGRALLNLRIQRQMLLGQLADTLGISSARLSQIEHGRRAPDASIVRDIIAALGLTTDDAASLRAAAEASREAAL